MSRPKGDDFLKHGTALRWPEQLAVLCMVVAAHALVAAAVIWLVKVLSPSIDAGGGSEQVQIRLVPPPAPSPAPARKPAPSSSVLARRDPAPNRKAPRIAVPTPPEETVREETVPTPEPPREEATPTPPTPRGSAFESFLPNGNFAYRNEQRQKGQDTASAPANDDLFKPRPGGDPLGNRQKPRVEVNEMNGLAYRMAIGDRVSETWGPMQYLPPDMEFKGKQGEVITYRVYINRDGTLRHVRNVNEDREPWRDFTAIDYVVTDVLDRVFPVAPVPNSIADDPLLFELPVRWMGESHSLIRF